MSQKSRLIREQARQEYERRTLAAREKLPPDSVDNLRIIHSQVGEIKNKNRNARVTGLEVARYLLRHPMFHGLEMPSQTYLTLSEESAASAIPGLALLRAQGFVAMTETTEGRYLDELSEIRLPGARLLIDLYVFNNEVSKIDSLPDREIIVYGATDEFGPPPPPRGGLRIPSLRPFAPHVTTPPIAQA